MMLARVIIAGLVGSAHLVPAQAANAAEKGTHAAEESGTDDGKATMTTSTSTTITTSTSTTTATTATTATSATITTTAFATAKAACATRRDCEMNEVCFGQEDPWHSLVQHPIGSCKACAEFNKTTCPWPCTSRDGRCSEHSLEMLTGLDIKPPFWFQVTSGCSKPVFTILFFGMDNPFVEKTNKASLPKQMAAPVAFGAMFASAMKADLKAVGRVLVAEIAWWEKLLLSGVVLLTSSNVASGFSALALMSAAASTRRWVREHAPGREEPEVHLDIWKRTYIIVTGHYARWFLMWVLAPVCLIVAACLRPLTLLYLPLVLVHCWIAGFLALGLAVSLLALLFGVGSLKRLARGQQRQPGPRQGAVAEGWPASDPEGQALAAAEELPDERKAEIVLALSPALAAGAKAEAKAKANGLLAKVYAKAEADEAEAEAKFLLAKYEEEAEVYRSTGLIHQSWVNYFGLACTSTIFTFWAPVLANCALGAGYWEAIATTLSTCHLSTYATSIVTGGLGPIVIFLWWIV